LSAKDFIAAENALGKLAEVSKTALKRNFARIPGAGAAGGLGFGMMTFANAKPESGFEIFSQHANLEKRLRKIDLILTGEGAIDQQTLMGKGVGQIALLCKKHKIPCVGIAGIVFEPEQAEKIFTQVHGLTQITNLQNAKAFPEEFLEKLTEKIAERWCAS
jgi:glycerate kinase